MKKKIAIAITGASGSIYAKVLIDKLHKIQDQIDEVSIVMSENAKFVWKEELGDKEYENFSFKIYGKQDFTAPFASGSANYNTLIICPCSMGTMGRIASGVSDDLITRSADVMLKERRRLILVARETPYNLIHINNMKLITEAGGVICPATPSFYSKPITFEELAATVIDRVLILSGLKIDSFRWGENNS